mmetsp:Transcript_11829/g.37081  ORF Transcript_11829/g.37081 Transcript_11829/m.37081 type:complete len:266 (+) Transcript_11829:259-1056(+)
MHPRDLLHAGGKRGGDEELRSKEELVQPHLVTGATLQVPAPAVRGLVEPWPVGEDEGAMAHERQPRLARLPLQGPPVRREGPEECGHARDRRPQRRIPDLAAGVEQPRVAAQEARGKGAQLKPAREQVVAAHEVQAPPGVQLGETADVAVDAGPAAEAAAQRRDERRLEAVAGVEARELVPVPEHGRVLRLCKGAATHEETALGARVARPTRRRGREPWEGVVDVARRAGRHARVKGQVLTKILHPRMHPGLAVAGKHHVAPHQL